MNKKDLRWVIDNGRITIWMKCPDHQPPHLHAFVVKQKEDLIIIQTQVRARGENLKKTDLKICQNWISKNKLMLLAKWAELEELGLIPKPVPVLKKDKQISKSSKIG